MRVTRAINQGPGDTELRIRGRDSSFLHLVRANLPILSTRRKLMNRTELSRPVLVSGPSAAGWETTCVLEPVRESGIHVKLPTGDAVPLSDMTLGVNRLLHFL